MPTEADTGRTPDAPLMQVGAQQLDRTDPFVDGRSIRNIQVQFTTGQSFTGQIADMQVELVGDQIVARGRLVGELDGQLVDISFADVVLFRSPSPSPSPPGTVKRQVEESLQAFLDEVSDCSIVALELGPIFMDLLGLDVDIPNPLINAA